MNTKQKRALELVLLAVLLPVLAFIGGGLAGRVWEQKHRWRSDDVDTETLDYCEQFRYREPVHHTGDLQDMAMLSRDLLKAVDTAFKCRIYDASFLWDAQSLLDEALSVAATTYQLVCFEQELAYNWLTGECEK